MNNYPTWWDKTTTVFNKYTDPTTQQVTWYAHKVDDCFWKFTGDMISIGNTSIDTQVVMCRIPKQENFAEREAWEAMSTEDKQANFTLGVGDILILGDATDEAVDEYTKDKRSTDLINKYSRLQRCMLVKRFSINVGGGRGNEHYLARGV